MSHPGAPWFLELWKQTGHGHPHVFTSTVIFEGYLLSVTTTGENPAKVRHVEREAGVDGGELSQLAVPQTDVTTSPK